MDEALEVFFNELMEVPNNEDYEEIKLKGSIIGNNKYELNSLLGAGFFGKVTIPLISPFKHCY